MSLKNASPYSYLYKGFLDRVEKRVLKERFRGKNTQGDEIFAEGKKGTQRSKKRQKFLSQFQQRVI